MQVTFVFCVVVRVMMSCFALLVLLVYKLESV